MKAHVIKIFGREPESMDELARCVIKVASAKIPVVGFAWNMKHGDVSNSHSRPMDGHDNWTGRKMKDGDLLPTSYPGWNGRVWIRYGEREPGFGSDCMRQTLTYVGGGGSGGYDGPFQSISTARWRQYGYKAPKDAYPEVHCFSWDYRIYDSDWPGVTEDLRSQMTYRTLAGQDLNFAHKFEWQDPETLAKDAEFMAYCASHPKKVTA